MTTTKPRVCARPDCRKRIPADAHHQRRYCGKACRDMMRRERQVVAYPVAPDRSANSADNEKSRTAIAEALRAANADPLLIAVAEHRDASARVLLDVVRAHLASTAGENRPGAPVRMVPPIPEAAAAILRGESTTDG